MVVLDNILERSTASCGPSVKQPQREDNHWFFLRVLTVGESIEGGGDIGEAVLLSEAEEGAGTAMTAAVSTGSGGQRLKASLDRYRVGD